MNGKLIFVILALASKTVYGQQFYFPHIADGVSAGAAFRMSFTFVNMSAGEATAGLVNFMSELRPIWEGYERALSTP